MATIKKRRFYTQSDLLDAGLTPHFIQLLRDSGLQARGDLYYGAAIHKAAEVLYGVADRELPRQEHPGRVPLHGDSGHGRRRAQVLPMGTGTRDLESILSEGRKAIKEACPGSRSVGGAL